MLLVRSFYSIHNAQCKIYNARPPLGGWGDCGGRGLRLHHLLADILGLLLIGRGLGVEIVGEEDEAQDDKEDNHLDGDDQPQGPPQCHGPETVDIEVVDTL